MKYLSESVINRAHSHGIHTAVCLEGVEPVVEAPLELSETERLVRLVYSPDKTTGLPSSDVMLFVSEAVDPKIKDFISRNVFGSGNPTPDSSVAPESDDECFDFIRNSGESVHDYLERIEPLVKARVSTEAKKVYLKNRPKTDD